MPKLLIKVLILIVSVFFTDLYSASLSKEISLSKAEQTRLNRGEIIERKLEQLEQTGQAMEAIGLINAPRADVLAVIVDFESYHKFMPNVRHVETLEQQDTSAVLNYYLELPMGIEQRYRVGIYWTSPDSSSSLVEWSSVEWPGLKPLETIKETRGYWLIHDAPDHKSLVLYHVYVDPGPVPFGFSWITDFMIEKSFPQVFINTGERIESLKDQ